MISDGAAIIDPQRIIDANGKDDEANIEQTKCQRSLGAELPLQTYSHGNAGRCLKFSI
jgi:hypothetical protein